MVGDRRLKEMASLLTGARVELVNQSEWLTAKEAAKYLRVQHRTLLLWVRQGKLQAYSLSGTKRHVWRFRRADLDCAVLAHPVIASPSPTVLSKERGTV